MGDARAWSPGRLQRPHLGSRAEPTPAQSVTGATQAPFVLSVSVQKVFSPTALVSYPSHSKDTRPILTPAFI